MQKSYLRTAIRRLDASDGNTGRDARGLRSERGGGVEFGGGFGGAGAADEEQENSGENQKSGDQENGDAEVEPGLRAVACGAGVGEALSAALGGG